MRQFQETYLFRASIILWNQRRTFYLIAANKKEATENAKRHLRQGEILDKISLLGKQSGDYFFK
jgi:hypothetical protein